MPRPFTTTDDCYLADWHEAGISLPAIAKRLGRPLADVSARLDRILNGYRAVPHRTAARTCLQCRDPFMSPHAGVRLCHHCRGRSVSPMEPEPVG